MPRWRSHASSLRQVETYPKNTGMAGLASVWAMARRRPIEGYGHGVPGRWLDGGLARSTVARWALRRRMSPYLVRSGQVWGHTPEQRIAASTLQRYSFGLRLAIAQADARPASFR